MLLLLLLLLLLLWTQIFSRLARLDEMAIHSTIPFTCILMTRLIIESF